MIYKAAQFNTICPAHNEAGTGLWDLSGKRGLVPLVKQGELIDREVTNYQYLQGEARDFGRELIVKAFRTVDGEVLYRTWLL